jgi:hypothetical protein
MREVILDLPVTPEFVGFLRNFGSVMTLDTMGPGFFKYELKDGFSIKGWVGDVNMEIRFRREVMDLCEDFCSVLFYYYHDGRPDMAKLRRMTETLSMKIGIRRSGND